MNIESVDYESTKDAIVRHLQADTKVKRPAFVNREKKLIGFAAYEKGEIVAGINGEIFWNNMHLSLLSVKHSYQGQGLGKALLKKMEEEAMVHSCRMMYVETMSWHAPDFYRRYGFEIVGTLDGYPIEGECQYYMRKWLV
ncbi:ribosomal protein S18 acetylase RimI-like enzyme [Geomicrobium halophilum]|uniref:Ribosomal protein S18 acetylase RimI-like enzyme n=1 Tax=Geomicrobium halophilum TaxID=549000 RepID=A0A841PWJ6_9BACL|nr:GNAT family N-acetyltransferase [Geomicrobium halophilum]MBB6448225.1 ribosomal protein S18 acetylase RimI-like enzyme [Geomicrobium halophilum]